MFYRDDKLALFIDGSNLYAAARALGFDIDYKKLLMEFANRGKLLRALVKEMPSSSVIEVGGILVEARKLLEQVSRFRLESLREGR